MSWKLITKKGNFDVAVVGVPKSGTNAAEKLCRLSGVIPSHHMHTPYREELYNKYKVLYMIRNPRNVLVSWCRYRAKPTEADMCSRIINFGYPSEEGTHGPSMYDMYKDYNRWMDYPKVFTLPYEDMIEGKVKLAVNWMKGNHRTDIKDVLPGGTPTWTGSPSNWRDYWTGNIDMIWRDTGMREIEKDLGYCKTEFGI